MSKKNLGNVDAITSMSDSDSVLIETGGSIRRVQSTDFFNDTNTAIDTLDETVTALRHGLSEGVLAASGTAGYQNIIRIVVKGSYVDYGLRFFVGQRENIGGSIYFLINTQAATTGGTVRYFYYDGLLANAYYVTTDDGVNTQFDIYLQTSSANDRVGVTMINTPINYYRILDITYPGGVITTLPDGAIQATRYSTNSLSVSTLSNGGGSYPIPTRYLSRPTTGCKALPWHSYEKPLWETQTRTHNRRTFRRTDACMCHCLI